MAKHIDGRPRHQQIAAEIRKAIMDGDLKVGSKLSSVRDLKDKFNVAVRTMQEALQVLKDEGLIVGQPGQGVFVLAKKPHVFDTSAYKAPAPGAYDYKILDVTEVRPPGDVADLLGLPNDGVAVCRHRLTSYGGVPVELDRSYYPADIARGTPLEQARKIRGGAPRVLAEAGYSQREFVDQVSVRPPTTEEFTLLEMPESAHLLCQTRVIYSDNQRPVEVSLLAMPGHLYELRYRQPIS